ncbi:MAG: segregation/condensation protein A [Deltaproteobacteria bacterium]|nr:segregation/condensation protein A [Deltaproteobacteria bacterium]
MDYNVRLDIFEGPLDLLLHLIKKNEVDIYDIPIAAITEEYIGVLDMMKEMNLDVAGEFLVVAATLVHIKSRMLLPVDAEAQGEDEEGVDPRAELIQRLLEYQRYKDAAVELNQRPMLGRDVFFKGTPVPLDELEEEAGLVNVSVFDLMEALKAILLRAPKERTLEFTAERFKIADKINYVMEVVGAAKSAEFTSLFPLNAMRGEIIVTFLAILELAKMLLIKIHQTEDGIIRVYLPAAAMMPADGPETQ